MKRILPIAILFLLGCLYSNAQTPVQIDPEVAAQHLLPSRMPIYPAIARAAHIEGTVVLLVAIDETGRVVSEKVISGPPMLQGAVVEGVKKFIYSPFQQDGKTIPITTTIGVRFILRGGSVVILKDLNPDNEQKHESEFLSSYAACDRQLQQRSAAAHAVELCQDAVQKAEKLSSGTSELRAALVDYANALIQDGKPSAALDQANRAIAAAKSNSNDVGGASAAYATAGEALALTGKVQEADKSFSTAEKYAHKAIGLTISHSSQREQLSETLKAMLEYHAKVLEKLGNQKEAQKKLKEAAKL